jgi:hypothetical protein
MTPPSHQTVRIGRGRHASPERGACVMELASMLAGERFTDRPKSVCPVIAGFLRSYNDLLPDGEHGELYPYAALVVGTAASGPVRRRRAARLLEWAGARTWRGRLMFRLSTWDLVVMPAARAALRMDAERRRTRVASLLDELVAIGPRPEAPAPLAGHPDSRSVTRV